MTKYRQLVRKYAIEIDTLKNARKQTAQALAELERIDQDEQERGDDYDFGRVNKAAFRWESASNHERGLAMRLQQKIEIEYHDVPYAAPRRQGIEKFWEEAGL